MSGHVFVAEIEADRLSLAVVFSLEPPKTAVVKYITTGVSVNTSVWLTAVVGVDWSFFFRFVAAGVVGERWSEDRESAVASRHKRGMALTRAYASDIVCNC